MEQKTSLDKALTLLETVAQFGDLGLRELAQKAGLSPSTVHRLLSTLVKRHYMKQDPESRRYGMGLKVVELSSRLSENFDLIGLARPVMRQLMEDAGETVNLVVFDDMEAVYIDQVANTHSLLRMFTRVGARVPLYCSGVGKVFLASLPKGQAQDYFQKVPKVRHTENTILAEDHFLQELAETKKRGYGIDNQETENGVRCVAAAIKHDARILAALSISGPSGRITDDLLPRLGQKVQSAACRIAEGAVVADYRPLGAGNGGRIVA